MKVKNKVTELQLYLTVLFVVSLLISNIVSAKQMLLPFNVTMTGGLFIFPVTYILSDLFSEVYGYRWSRVTCYLAFGMNLFMVIIFSLVIATPAPSYWTDQSAFETVLGSTFRVLVASSVAFICGDFVNDRVFRLMKNKYPDSSKGFGSRAILSSLCGEFVDSLIFLPIAFLGQMPVQTMITTLIIRVILKTLYEIIILPLTTYVVKKVSYIEEVHQCC